MGGAGDDDACCCVIMNNILCQFVPWLYHLGYTCMTISPYVTISHDYPHVTWPYQMIILHVHYTWLTLHMTHEYICPSCPPQTNPSTLMIPSGPTSILWQAVWSCFSGSSLTLLFQWEPSCRSLRLQVREHETWKLTRQSVSELVHSVVNLSKALSFLPFSHFSSLSPSLPPLQDWVLLLKG